MKSKRLLNGLILALLLASTIALPTAGAPAGAMRQTQAPDKIEALVLEELAAKGQTDYFIWMVEKADLSPADQLPTKLEKGQFVLDMLRATADRTQADLRAFLDARGVDYRAYYIANKILVRGGSQDLLMDVAARPDVDRVTANHVYQLDEPIISEKEPPHTEGIEPNITFVKADQVWALGVTGQGTVMAGNDTGLDETHPAIAPHYRGCMDPPVCTTYDHNYNWWDATGTYPTNPWDGYGHGTHTTGTMVGDDGGSNQIGMAPGAQTVHCKNMTDGGSGDDGTFTECFEWDLAPWDLNGQNANPAMAPDAINNSWGYWGGGEPQFKDEIQALHAAGVLVEVSAGNEGSSCSSLRSPGDYWEVMTTGSINHVAAYPGTLTGFSSRGPSSLDPGYYFPDIMAPGENIRSSVPGGSYEGGWSGTSMAGPHATALVGLMWSACPSLKGMVEQTIDMIQQTAVPLAGQGGSNCGGDYQTGPNNDWGFGTIDALAAVQMAIAQCVGVGTLEGHAYDADTMAPIEGAKITADWEGGYSWIGVTDADGFYQMAVPIGLYDITAEAFAYLTQTVTGVEVFEDMTTVQDFAMVAAPEYEVSGTVTEAGTGTPLSAEIAVLDTPLPPVQTNPATGFYSIMVPEGTYTFRATADLHQPEEREIVVDQNQTQDFSLLTLPCILLVDDDGNNPDVQSYYTAALDNLGLDYDVWDVAGQGDPAFANLFGYKMVLWWTGYPWGNTFNGTNEAAVGQYLDAGGKFFLSSQDYLYDFGLTPFGQNYFHIASYTSDVGQTTATGQNVFAGLGPFALNYPFTNYSDVVNPDGQAQVAFIGNYGNAAVSYDGGTFQTVFLGFPFEAIPNLADRANVLATLVDWFGGCEPPATMHVGNILPFKLPGPSRNWGLGLVRILDEAGAPVDAATVSATWEWPTGHMFTQAKMTVPNGWARFVMLLPVAGTYELCVTDVAKGGMIYDPDQNAETCDTITVP